MNTNRRFNKPFRNGRKVTVQDKLEKTPEHIRNIVYILNNNAEIRRFTSLAMIKELRACKAVPENSNVFIKFGLGKYSVCVNGLNHEYTFENNLFVDSFEKAFEDFTKHGHAILQAFVNEVNKEENSDNTNSPVEEDDVETSTAE